MLDWCIFSKHFSNWWFNFIMVTWLYYFSKKDTKIICLFYYHNLSQYFKKFYKSVSIRKSNLKFCTVTSTKDLHQIPKNQISVAEPLMKCANISFFQKKKILKRITVLSLFYHLCLNYFCIFQLFPADERFCTECILIKADFFHQLRWLEGLLIC